MWRRCYVRTNDRKFDRAVGARWFLRWFAGTLGAVCALDLTMSRPSSGFGTFQLEAVMFRNPNWVAYRKPLRSSFCTGLSLSMSCDVVCFVLPRTSGVFFGHRGSKAIKHWPGCGLRIFCDKSSLQRQVRLFVRSPYYAALCLSQLRKGGRWLESSVHGDLVCGAQEAACLRVLCV